MKKFIVIALLMVMVSSLAWAQDMGMGTGMGMGNSTGDKIDVSVMYFSSTFNADGRSDTFPGYLLRGNFGLADAWKIDLEYNSNQKDYGTTVINNNNVNVGTAKYYNFKFGVRWVPYKTPSGDLGIRLFTQNNQFENAFYVPNLNLTGMQTYNLNGIGMGVVGNYKMNDKVGVYGLMDYNPNMRGNDKNVKDFTLEAGLKFNLPNNTYATVGYRSSNFSQDLAGSAQGFLLGLGIKM